MCPRRLRLLALPALAALLAALPGPAADRPAVEANANRRLLDFYRSDPAQLDRLRQNLAAFRALPPERQAQLRKLDRDLAAEPPAARAREERVLATYARWVDRLPEPERRKLERATPLERLVEVKRLRDEQLRARLPAGRIAELERSGLDPSTPLERIQRERRWRHDDWRFLEKAGDEPLDDLKAALASEEFRNDLLAYARGPVRPLLNPEERQRLDFAEREVLLPHEHPRENWLALTRAVAEISVRHTLPSLPGPARAASPYIGHAIELHRKIHAENKPGVPKPRPKWGIDSIWPQAAITLAEFARQHKVPILHELGPANLDELCKDCGDAMRPFVTVRLMAKLTPGEKKELERAEAQWPKYPQTVADLAHKHGLKVPGMELPAPPDFWVRFRPRPPEFPDPPEALLVADFVQQLSRPDSVAAQASLADPADRERIKRDYFLRHPDELEWLRRLEMR
jgi:hypothetical protein